MTRADALLQALKARTDKGLEKDDAELAAVEEQLIESLSGNIVVQEKLLSFFVQGKSHETAHPLVVPIAFVALGWAACERYMAAQKVS